MKSLFFCEFFNGLKVYIFDIKNIIVWVYGLILKYGFVFDFGWFDFWNYKYDSWEL